VTDGRVAPRQVVPALPLASVPARQAPERAWLVHRAKVLAWGGIGWHAIEFGIALAAGLATASIALVGFGIDSLVEGVAGLVVVWRFTGRRVQLTSAERRAQQLIATSFFVLGVYVAVGAVRTLAGGVHPRVSRVGIGLAAITAAAMPLLARAKRRVGRQLGSVATVKEGRQNQLCAYLSIALLVGLGRTRL